MNATTQPILQPTVQATTDSATQAMATLTATELCLVGGGSGLASFD
jgi:hypothetical protein